MLKKKKNFFPFPPYVSITTHTVTLPVVVVSNLTHDAFGNSIKNQKKKKEK